jgi:histidine triad (HIT) family protein
MPGIFSKIVAGEISSYKVAESEKCFAFLDIQPLVKGHVLVIPKKEIDYIFDIDDPLYNELWTFAKQVAVAMKKVITCKRIGVAVIGLEVAHAHIHLIPLQSVSDINFSQPKIKVPEKEMNEIAHNIYTSFQSIN